MPTITIRLRTLVAFASGLAVAAIAVAVFQAWNVDAAPGDSDTTFVPITPCRLIDTRPAPNRVGPHGSFGTFDTRTVAAHGAQGDCNIPSDAVGLSTNVTAVGATENTFLTMWGDGAQPTAANLNPRAGGPVTPNAVNTPLSAAGSFNVFNKAGRVDVVIDVNGYYTRISLQQLVSEIGALRNTTVTFSGHDMQTVGSLNTIIGSANGCAVMFDSRYGFLALPIPEGATITEVTADIYPSDGYEARLQRHTSSGSGQVATDIATASGPSQSANVDVDLTPPDEVVEPGERFVIRFDDQAINFGSGLCSVRVSYRLPG